MLRARIIPCLLIRDGSLVKTVRFRRPSYIGEPVNSARIFNEFLVDELFVLDISATPGEKGIDYQLLGDLASECFMPVGYGGGISNLDQVEKVLNLGFEKVVINSAALRTPSLITSIAKVYGSQCVVVAIDVGKSVFGRRSCYAASGRINSGLDPVKWARQVEDAGAGEILLTAIYQEGTWNGFDVELVREVVKSTSIPVIANGGAGSQKDITDVLVNGGASSVAIGSMVVYQKKGAGVLVNFPLEGATII